MPSRTTWLVISIVGLIAFIVGGGVALLDDGGSTPSPSVPAPRIVSPTPARSSSPAPSETPNEHGNEGGDQGQGGGEDDQGEDGEGD